MPVPFLNVLAPRLSGLDFGSSSRSWSSACLPSSKMARVEATAAGTRHVPSIRGSRAFVTVFLQVEPIRSFLEDWSRLHVDAGRRVVSGLPSFWMKYGSGRPRRLIVGRSLPAR